ncbi:MAG: LPP20 family lipoprotein [Deltaproteobacteria bacterium]|nr:LPP20 family lipoprotein [Deltaproteobacteria bacterium]
MSNRLTIIGAAITAATLFACNPGPPQPVYGGGGGGGGGAVRSGAKPDWVDGTPSRYPQMQYLFGVGRGQVRMPCESDARAALAKTFEAKVVQVSKDWMGHFSRVNAAGKVHVEAMAISQLTRVSTDYVLRGAKVVEVWKGPGAFHCLGIIDRLPAARTLREEIGKLDVQIAAKVREGDAAPGETAKFFAYKRAMELLQRREALNAELRIIDPNGMGQKPIVGWADLVAKFTGSASRIKIGLKLTGKDHKRLQTCLAEQLGKEKITVLETSNDVDLFIRGALKWQWAGVNNGQFMVKIELNLRVFDMESGKTVGAITDELLTGRPQKQRALQTANTKLCYKMAPRIAREIKKQLSR